MKGKKLNYVTPALMGLHADFEGVICISGTNPGGSSSIATDPTPQLPGNHSNRYGDAQSW